MTTYKVSREKAIEVQTDDLKMWKKLLNEETYLLLEKHCERENAFTVTGSKIERGTKLGLFLMNLNN